MNVCGVEILLKTNFHSCKRKIKDVWKPTTWVVQWVKNVFSVKLVLVQIKLVILCIKYWFTSRKKHAIYFKPLPNWAHETKMIIKWAINVSYLLSDGSRESRAKDDSFLLSGWVMLSMRSTHISITLPNNWSVWTLQRMNYLFFLFVFISFCFLCSCSDIFLYTFCLVF